MRCGLSALQLAVGRLWRHISLPMCTPVPYESISPVAQDTCDIHLADILAFPQTAQRCQSIYKLPHWRLGFKWFWSTGSVVGRRYFAKLHNSSEPLADVTRRSIGLICSVCICSLQCCPSDTGGCTNAYRVRVQVLPSR